MGLQRHVYVGAFAHCKSLQELDICPSGAIGVGESGKIEFIERNVDDIASILKTHGWEDAEMVKIKGHGFFFPGFVDTHIHAPQYPNAGIFGKSTLLDWLETYTYPIESSLSSLSRAHLIYPRIVARTLSHGTTTAAYYATIHVPATNFLASTCLARGQRAFIGRVCMDTDLSPTHYRDASADDALSATQACIAHVDAIDPAHALITPIITPRFAPSCTRAALTRHAELARARHLPVQTHIAENAAELELVRTLFPDQPSYTAVYDSVGLLGPKTVLAHAIHISAEERSLMRERGASVSHCPVSNSALGSGRAKVRKLVEDGVTVGLGTDVSGGYSASVLVAAREAVFVSRHVAMEEQVEERRERVKLADAEALWMATKGGAKALGLEGKVGGFDVGMEWDAQMVVLSGVTEEGEAEGEGSGLVDVFGWESWEERLSKWLYNGDDRNTASVWVKGRLVHKTRTYPG